MTQRGTQVMSGSPTPGLCLPRAVFRVSDLGACLASSRTRVSSTVHSPPEFLALSLAFTPFPSKRFPPPRASRLSSFSLALVP